MAVILVWDEHQWVLTEVGVLVPTPQLVHPLAAHRAWPRQREDIALDQGAIVDVVDLANRLHHRLRRQLRAPTSPGESVDWLLGQADRHLAEVSAAWWAEHRYSVVAVEVFIR